MHVLVKGLPRESLLRTPRDRRGPDPWTSYHELLAQIVEIVSIGAADHRLKKPVKIKRPGEKTKADAGTTRVASAQAGPNPYRRAMTALGAAPPPRLRVVKPEDDEHEEDRTP